MRRVLRLPAFRRLLAAYTANATGDWLGEIALSVLILEATDSVLAVTALWVLGRFVPALVAPLLATAIPARALPLLFAGEAGLFGALAVAAATGAPVSVLLALATADGLLALAARAHLKAAIVHATRPAGLLREGNATINLAFMVSLATGPVLGGAIVLGAGSTAALVLDAFSFAIAAALLAAGVPATAQRERAAIALRSAFAHLRTETLSRRLVLADGAAGVLFALIIPVEVVFVTHTLGGTAAEFGLVLGAWGLGAVLGAVLLALAREAPSDALLLAGAAAMIAGYLGMGAAQTVTVVVIWSAVGGVGNGIADVLLVTLVQERTPAALQVPIGGVLEAIRVGAPGLGYLLGGMLAAGASPRATYWAAGLGALAVVACCTIALRRRAGSAPAPTLAESA